jgi:hypothetical protein
MEEIAGIKTAYLVRLKIFLTKLSLLQNRIIKSSLGIEFKDECEISVEFEKEFSLFVS